MPIGTDRAYNAAMPQDAPAMHIDFATDPGRYRHWRLACAGAVATLTLDVDPAGGLFPGTELKLNSYDLGVDIELADAVTRLRFEHPEVRAVVIRSAKENVFCAGANIGALARASHMPTRSISANSPTRRASRSRMPRSIPASVISRRSAAPRPAAAMSWRWPATGSC